ncbi:MAG: hypothetical protein EKK35_17900 [Bradyrhizobiaceae bacterium]|nr:MAG: hypothetical protein EKK35_17900 [Bradyrhizobiaceae bacterium]
MKDIASDLKERFDYAAYFYLSAWERDPNGLIDEQIVYDYADAETQLIDTFETLRDSVDAVPESLIAAADKMRSTLGPEKFAGLVGDAIQNIGRGTLPKDATEFLEVIVPLENSLRTI